MELNNTPGLWVTELHQGNIAISMKVKDVLFSEKSAFQKIDILETYSHGKVLLNDGVFMLSERDEFIYHEMIAHVPLFSHPAPEKVLVIGGGDGGTIREVLKHESVTKVVMVEIDEMVIQACKTHLPTVASAFSDKRLEIRIDDGVNFVKENEERFDVVIVDSTDPVGPARPLFDRDFYREVSEILYKDGIMVTQTESPFYDRTLQIPILENQRPFFDILHIYLYFCPTFPGGLWSFGFSSQNTHPIPDFRKERLLNTKKHFRYYSPGIHVSAFILPEFVKEGLGGILDPVHFDFSGESIGTMFTKKETRRN